MLETILIIAVVILVVGGGIFYAVWLSKRLNTERVDEKQSIRRERRKSVKPIAVPYYLERKVYAFYNALIKALPSHYIVLPSVSAELLFQENQRVDLRLWGYYADIVVFTQTFTPVLVIDLQDFSLTGGVTHALDEDVVDVIKLSGIGYMQFPIKESYNIDEIRKAVAKAMNPLYNQK